MSGIRLYKSKYGSTKKYAEWLAEETGFAPMDVGNASIENVSQYDTVLFGGGVYASGIAGLSFLKKHWGSLGEKKVLVFICGASPYDKKAFDAIVASNMKDGLSGVPCFYCRGAFDMSSMTFRDKTLCKLLQKSLAKKDPEEYEVWERALMEVPEGERGDWTDKTYIQPILEALRQS